MTKKLSVMTVALSLAMAAAHAQEPQTQQPPPGETASAAPVTTQTPAAPAPMRIQRNAKLFIEPSDFGKALSAAILKKKVPVVAMTDRDKADFFVETASNAAQEKKTAVSLVSKILVLSAFAGSSKTFDATVTVANRDGAIVFAHNSKKSNFQSAAENIANELKKHIERK